MYFVKTSAKSFEHACEDLEAVVKENNYGVLHVHDLGETLRGKDIPFTEQCRVFEVCNPTQAFKVMSTDMSLNMALPCRISVYTEGGEVKIGMIRPAKILESLSDSDILAEVAKEVEESTIIMIESAA